MTSIRSWNAGVALVALLGCGCGQTVAVPKPSVELVCEVLPGGVEARVSAAVRGDSSSLKYVWFPENQARPPVSEDGKALFLPKSPGVNVVGVKVYYTRDLFVQSSTTCVFGAGPAGQQKPGPVIREQPKRETLPQNVAIEITSKQGIDPVGGPDTRAEIAGRVTGVGPGSGMYVAVYSKTDRWYLQPYVGSRTPFDSSGNWRTWTHTGSRYAALLVGAGFNPPPVLEVLPSGPLVAAMAESPRSH